MSSVLSDQLFDVDLLSAITTHISEFVAVGIGLAIIAFLLGHVIWFIIDLMRGGLV